MLRGPNSFQLFPKIGKLNDGRLRSSKVSNRNADGVGRVSDRRRAARKSAGTVIAIGCTGGKHRSVVTSFELAERLGAEPGVAVRVTHRDLGRE